MSSFNRTRQLLSRIPRIVKAAAVFGLVIAAVVACSNWNAASGADVPLTMQAAYSTASGSSLPHISDTNLAMPVEVSLDIADFESTNNPGPTVTVSGLTSLGGYGVEMTFTNNLKGTHTYTAENAVDTVVQPAGDTISIPKQPVNGGTGGNPYIWVQLINADGSPASDEIFVGRVVQGAGWHVDVPSNTIISTAWADFSGITCDNSPGPYISLDTGMTLAGLSLRVIFRNSDNKVGGPHEADVTRNISLIGADTSFTFPKQPVQGGVGGNPWIFAGFTDGHGSLLDAEQTLLGRCVQLSR